MSPSPICEICFETKGICKDYSVRVLDGIDFELRSGEVHGLLGANGAGKSTFCRIVAGLTPATQGSMKCAGSSYVPTSKQDAESFGVQIVQQELTLVPTLTVAENLFLNRLPNRFGLINRRELRRAAGIALSRVGLESVSSETLAGELGIGQQQLVEIANAIDRQCRVLILDEPTAMLTATESQRLFRLIDDLKTRGIGIIYISHRLKEVSAITDRITILRDGKKVGTFDSRVVSTDQMVEIMSGSTDSASSTVDVGGVGSGKEKLELDRDIGKASLRYAKPARQAASTRHIAMSVEKLSNGTKFESVSFDVARGEVLGVSGLIGSGRTELLRAIFGADRATHGVVRLFLDPIDIDKVTFTGRFASPSQAVSYGLALVTEDRKDNGLLLSQSIGTNLTLANLSQVSNRLGLLERGNERKEVTRLVADLDVRCQGTEQVVGTLSGGNQQKVAIGKWLFKDAGIFLFDEPTRGIDLAARERIYRLIDQLADAGKAVVIVSSDIEELLQTCDRIGVMSSGRWVRVFDRDEFDPELITETAFSSFK